MARSRSTHLDWWPRAYERPAGRTRGPSNGGAAARAGPHGGHAQLQGPPSPGFSHSVLSVYTDGLKSFPVRGRVPRRPDAPCAVTWVEASHRSCRWPTGHGVDRPTTASAGTSSTWMSSHNRRDNPCRDPVLGLENDLPAHPVPAASAEPHLQALNRNIVSAETRSRTASSHVRPAHTRRNLRPRRRRNRFPETFCRHSRARHEREAAHLSVLRRLKARCPPRLKRLGRCYRLPG